MFDKSLSFYKKIGVVIGQGAAYLGKGDIFLFNGDNSKAIEMYDKALLCFKKSGSIGHESIFFYRKAQALAKQGKKKEAMALFEKSISNLEKVRMQTSFSQAKQAFMEKFYYKYENTVVFMLENNYYERGYKYAESIQARVFLDRLAEGLERLNKGIPLDFKQKRDNLVSKLSFLGKEMSKASGYDDKTKLKELKDQHSEVKNELDDLLIKISLNNPLYASVRYPEPASVKYLQQEVLKNEELLLRYFISREKIYVFLISKEDFEVVTLKDAAPDVKKMVEQYLISVEENNNPHMKEYAGELYKKLFRPLETSIKNRRNIIIVPGGELAKIPFETFVIDVNTSKQPVYLLEKYRVKYIRSASVLSILRKHYQRKSTSKRFIGFGDPVYDYDNFKNGKPEKGSFTLARGKNNEISQIHRGRYQREGGALNRLESSGLEVNAIAGLFKKQDQEPIVYERERATEEKAKSPDLKEFDYIHFSCHGVLGDDFQGLVLSQIPGAPEDGYLTLNEIMNCDYHAKLVVLSACQTGKGKMERAEGVIGLTRAVMYAGTPAVVASPWNVEENATKELMVKFYKYMLEEKLDKDEALRKAKLSSPFYWGAFVMYGE
jgi:CHAT domain-containing protein